MVRFWGCCGKGGPEYRPYTIGVIIACLYIDGTMPLLNDLVKISFSGWEISDALPCNSLIGIGSSNEEEFEEQKYGDVWRCGC